MERIKSKVRRPFVVFLLCVAAVTTASSQQNPTKAIDLNALAARGEALANEDPLALELHNLQSEGPARHGFDIGMGVAEGHTLPGPGKDRTCNSLPPGEQEGCRIAVLFSVERNRNAKLAATGAAIAKADERVAAARNAAPESRIKYHVVFYRLGFDIATGIFGDPALGAKGNTATGDGSLGIRDSLSPAGQLGFNASVKFHLGQEPPPSAPERRPRTPGEATRIDNSAVVTRADNFGKRSPALDEVFAGFPKAGAEPSHEILCRGGRDKLIFTPENSKLSPNGETIVITLLTFEPGPEAAGPRGEGLHPGECSWRDRPITGRFLIRFEASSRTIAEYMNDSNHYWSFFGTRPVNNFLTTTGNGYWAPDPVKAVGRTRIGAPEGPKRPICDVAREARARNSPAAPGLEESCRAELAAKGAAIAHVDRVVAEARAAETDPLYWQGFDIATGIFGDPALGANGNTSTGPGSLGIRDSLNAAGQRGFNASVKLHLSRNYRP